ncbi:anaerobic C4-dicarboxylate transporter [Budviciaceae bacterium CWB-B4]|uniref:C4-dicarboxylate transporter n=2 Tax=Limnobaculum xujianqingii TaxID=2738837 RepID=A0A9D7AHA0_9GAMM|nr:anaerobic C4-dicarboxylate transporter family protein [Limnobaculum xujianqingii]MBK5072678.1 anaerobic C4-dicarboxylate transporter [Limnobaculum xujianqingii]MBK5175987.1 anaerobic C4-dicarboxylate transporter [Limnobaculum xujianqingii]
MSELFWVQLLVVLVCIGVGGRYGGVGLGAAGGLGVCILTLLFGLQPASPPIAVLLIIIAVIACTSVLQGAGGLDFLVRVAEKMLRKKPSAITFLGPFICSLFVMFCGTAYVAFAVYPVVAEVAAEAKIRPERPMSMCVIAAGIAVIASPMSAATAGMIAALSMYDVSIIQILGVSIPAFIIGTLCGCLSVFKRGKELENDPEFQRRIAAGDYQSLHVEQKEVQAYKPTVGAKIGVLIFGIGVATVILFGSVKSLLPAWEVGGKMVPLATPALIQMVMLAAALFIIIFSKVPSDKFASGSVFRSGLIGVVGVFGISWMTGTFFDAYRPLFEELFKHMVESWPMLFGLILFCFSAVIFSPSATVAALMPLGAAMGIPPALLVAMYPATCGDFIVPGAGQIGCVAFDRTGTTRLGKYVINHSYLRPGFVMVISAVIAGYFISQIVF